MWAELGLTVASIPLVLLGAVYYFQDRILYLPQFPPGSRGVPTVTPFAIASLYEDVHLTTADGVSLHGWLMPKPNSPFVLVYFHGNAGNIANRLVIFREMLQEIGCSVLAIDYRGYGASDGVPNEKGLREDGLAVMQYLQSHSVTKHQGIVLYGQSLGGGVASFLADTYRSDSVLKGVILENTFLSIPKMVGVVFPLLKPVSWLATNVWDNEKHVSSFTEDTAGFSMLFLAGEKDEIVPHDQMKKLYRACALSEENGRKTWVSFPRGTHNETCLLPGFYSKIAAWLKTLAQSHSQATFPPAGSSTIGRRNVHGEGVVSGNVDVD
eukprot:ANDGO_05684.mRNA.1 Protein bem46